MPFKEESKALPPDDPISPRGKAPLRKGECTVLNKVAQAYRSKLCQRLALPKSVKEVLQRSRDEDAWVKLEHFRKAIALGAQGEVLVFLATQEEALKGKY